MNMKQIVLYSALLIFFAAGPAAEAKMTVDYKKKDVDYSSYPELYVQNIDLRGMTFEIYDDDKREFYTDHLDEKTLNDLALEMYDHFFVSLKDVIPINENQEVDPSKKALILNIKMTGTFKSEERGVIMWLITKSKAAETTVYLECQLLDAQTKEELAVIKDEHVFTSPVHDQPLSQPEEFTQFTDIFRAWSTRFSKVFEELRRGTLATE